MMSRSHQTAWILAAAAALGIPTVAPAGVELLGTSWQPDEVFPEHARFWFEDLAVKSRGFATSNLAKGGLQAARPDPGAASQPAEQTVESWYARRPHGGHVHVFLRNTGAQAAGITDVQLEGVSLTRAIAFSPQRIKRKPASIYFAGLPAGELHTLEAAGEPVWWRVDPQPIPAGGTAELLLRLRHPPAGTKFALTLQTAEAALQVTVPVHKAPACIDGIAFSPQLDRVYLYCRSRGKPGAAPSRILLDGRDLKTGVRAVTDARLDVVPVVVQLDKALAPGSFHCFQAAYDDGTTATAALRAWGDEFAYGMWGGRAGKEGDSAAASACVRELHEHQINVQMPQLGSPMLADFYSSPAGQRQCEALGLRRLISDPGKWNTRRPYAYFIHDEPDCGDYLITGLPAGHQVGSLAQWAAGRSQELRAADPATPQLLNVDMTYKPDNWYTYGQLADIFSADPYYQVRLWEVYGKHPERRALYRQAGYIYAVGQVCRSAAAPRPLHLVLYACRHGGEGSTFTRFPTPAEKRIEVYYALAAGARGLSFWWFTPTGGKSAGLGSSDPAAKALWREVGLLGAEVRTAGPILVRSTPAALPCKPSPGLWARTLIAGSDTVILLAVNDGYENTPAGTAYKPIENAAVALDLPAWLADPQVFEIAAGGIRDIPARQSGRSVTVSLGRLDLTRLVVLTADAGLRANLRGLYDRELKANVQRLTRRAD